MSGSVWKSRNATECEHHTALIILHHIRDATENICEKEKVSYTVCYTKP